MNRRSFLLLQRGGRRPSLALGIIAALAALVFAGCDVEWGGISVELREPAIETADTSALPDSVVETPPLALPSGPLLFHVRRTDELGRAGIEPVAELQEGELRPVGPLLAERAGEYVSDFIARYYQSDQAYTLFRGSTRVGTFYVGAPAVQGSGLCLELRARGRIELRPQADTLSEFLAWPPGVRTGADSLVVPDYRSDMVSLSQVLARLGVRDREIPGVWRFRAPTDLRAVQVGSGPRGFAASFTVGDALEAGPPPDSAGVLFIVADYDRSRGYFPLYFDAAWYGPGQKRALRWIDAADLLGDTAREWLLHAYGDADSWYELVAQRDTVRSVVWSSRRPVCEAEGPGAGS
ncbi:MAG: hypothetical protein JSV86_15450 [Gemmatimonadota bacterium]|nr:MAG: hypothetical protein JSV86_15450 [Gemmatimonadota bacterium]